MIIIGNIPRKKSIVIIQKKKTIVNTKNKKIIENTKRRKTIDTGTNSGKESNIEKKTVGMRTIIGNTGITIERANNIEVILTRTK